MHLVIYCLLALLALPLIRKLYVIDLSFWTNCGTVFVGSVLLVTRCVPLITLSHVLSFDRYGLRYQREVSCRLVVVQNVEVHLCLIVAIL